MENATEPKDGSQDGRSGPRRIAERYREEAAFRELYDHHLPAVLAFLRLLIRDDQDRADVASRTFETAAKHWSRFETPEGQDRETAERNWLFTIARNEASSWRRRHRQPEEIDVEAIEAPANPESDVGLFQLVNDLLWTLSERDRALYVLHHRDERTHEELAEMFSLPLGTVKSALARAQNHLDTEVRRLCAREKMDRLGFLRGLAIPIFLRHTEEDVDREVSDYVWNRTARDALLAGAAPSPAPPSPEPLLPTVAARSAAPMARDVLGGAGATTGVKLAAVAISSAIGGAAAFALLWPRPDPVRVPVASAGAVTAPLAAAPADLVTANAPAATSPPAVVATGASRVPPASSGETFQTEGDSMQAARNAFASGDFARALKLADQHVSRYKGGKFAAECSAVAIRSLAQLGRTAEARTRADTFRKAFPQSIFRGAVDAATGGPTQ